MLLEVTSLLAAAIVLVYMLARPGGTKPTGLPPGPRPLPIIGNLLEVIKWQRNKEMNLEATKTAKQYGKIFTLELPNLRIVVINSASIARQALISSKDDFSGRPYTFIADYVGRGCKSIGSGDFSSIYLLQCKIMHTAMRFYNPYTQGNGILEAEELCTRFLMHDGAPIDPKNDLDMARMNNSCAIVFGKRYKAGEDKELKSIVELTNSFFSSISMGNWVDIFPFLINFPIRDSQAVTKYRQFRDRYLETNFREHLASYQKGVTRDITDALITSLNNLEQEKSEMRSRLTHDHVAMILTDVFGAGFQSTTMTLLWFILYMMKYPQVQRKAQKEMDDVIGSDVMPTWEDRGRLPYMEATLAETIRMSTTGPFGVPHKATKDSQLAGFHIPQGTMVVINLWALHHDEEEWENPEEFNPERFLDPEGRLLNTGSIHSYIPFGAGRRSCVGEALARQQLFVVTTRLLCSLTFDKPPGEPEPEMQGESGFLHVAKPFKVCIRQRQVGM